MFFERTHRWSAAALALIGGLAVVNAQNLPGGQAPSMLDAFVNVTVTVDRSIKYQTILGWGGTLSFSRNLNYVAQPVVDQLIDDLVDNLGLTLLRVQDGVLDEPLNDNGDPNVIDWSGFHDGPAIDKEVDRGLRRFITQVRAHGQHPTIMLVKDWRGSVPAWMDDAEIAEHLFANVRYYKDHHDIDIDFIAVANEPNPLVFMASRYPRIAQLFSAKIQAAGLTTRLTFNEGKDAETTWNAVAPVRNDDSLWANVGLLSWHGPGPGDPFRAQLRDFAASRRLPTAMTGFPGATIDDLFNDLTQANVSYWARNWIVESGLSAESNNNTYFALGYDGVSFRHNQAYHRFREVMGGVPQGAVRIQATSSDPALRVAVFEKDNIAYVVGFNASSTRMSVSVQGMSSFGTTRTYSSFSGPDGMTVPLIPLPGPARSLDVPPGEAGANVPAPASGGPIPGVWSATPTSVTLPSSSVQLRARAAGLARAGDFGDTLPPHYDWEYVDGPASSQVVISENSAGPADISGLTAPGTYEFRVFMSNDSRFVTVSSRSLRVRVFQGNQAPVISEGYRYNRDEWLVAPQSSQTYGPDFISAVDIENDPLTTSFAVVSQPQGAAAAFNGATVTGMTRTGQYVFRFTARDATHTVTREFVRTVVDDPTRAGPGARRSPAGSKPVGSAAPRGGGIGTAARTATTQASVSPEIPQRPVSSDTVKSKLISQAAWLRDTLEADAELMPAGLRPWRHFELLDVDEDGEVDLVRIEFEDGLVLAVLVHQPAGVLIR